MHICRHAECISVRCFVLEKKKPLKRLYSLTVRLDVLQYLLFPGGIARRFCQSSVAIRFTSKPVHS